jgi:hypothetical protein
VFLELPGLHLPPAALARQRVEAAPGRLGALGRAVHNLVVCLAMSATRAPIARLLQLRAIGYSVRNHEGSFDQSKRLARAQTGSDKEFSRLARIPVFLTVSPHCIRAGWSAETTPLAPHATRASPLPAGVRLSRYAPGDPSPRSSAPRPHPSARRSVRRLPGCSSGGHWSTQPARVITMSHMLHR